MTDQISDIGVNPLFATELMTKLGLSSSDLQFPSISSQVQDIAKFLSKEEDPMLFISRSGSIRGNRDVHENVKHLYEYINLHKNKRELSSKLRRIDEEISLYEK
jgi:hypothetical protein